MTRRRWLLAAVVVVVLWGAAAGLLLLRTVGDVRAGRDAAGKAREQLDLTTLISGGPAFQLERAGRRFDRAAATSGGVVLAPLRVVPVLGRQLRSVHALSGVAGTVSDTGAVALRRVSTILDEHSGGGPQRVDQLRALAKVVDDAAARVARIHSLGPSRALLAPLRSGYVQAQQDLVQLRRTLRDGAAGTHAAVDLLDGPKRYLLVAANNAEMRAGSGMWLSGGLLTTAAGRFELGAVAPLYLLGDPPNGAVAVTDADLEARWGSIHPSWDFRSLMTSPRFPVAAELAARMWEAGGQPAVDGVVVVDPVAVQAVLRTVGPVTTGGRTIDADNVLDELLFRQYATFDGSAPEEQGDRRNVLADVAKQALSSLDRGGWSVTTLVSQLADAARGRHLLLWAKDRGADDAWDAAGLGGRLDGRSVLPSLLNFAGNKMDWFLHTDAELAVRPVGADTEVTVRLRLSNQGPAQLPHYVSGPPPAIDYPPGSYRGILTLDVPAAATGLSIDGEAQPFVTGRDGASQVVGTKVDVPRGATRDTVVRFRLQGRHGSLRIEPSARVPGIDWRFGDATWQDSSARSAKW